MLNLCSDFFLSLSFSRQDVLALVVRFCVLQLLSRRGATRLSSLNTVKNNTKQGQVLKELFLAKVTCVLLIMCLSRYICCTKTVTTVGFF